MRSSLAIRILVRVTDACWTPADAAYPPRLRALGESAPKQLHVRGTLPPLSPSVAIVGSRRATEDSRVFTVRLAFELASAGVTIISGGALGIDGAAHQGAIDAEAATLVVLPTSLADPAPRAHALLFRRVLEYGGAWIAEQTGVARRTDFLTRNRLIAALADLVIVVQGAAQSGTRHTVSAARRLNKPLAAVPWPPNDPRGAVCLEILRKRGPPITSSKDVLGLLGLKVPRGRARPAIGGGEGGSPERKAVLRALVQGPTNIDALQRATGISAAALLALVTELEIEGMIALRGSGRIERVA